jgi:hypothetical protein
MTKLQEMLAVCRKICESLLLMILFSFLRKEYVMVEKISISLRPCLLAQIDQIVKEQEQLTVASRSFVIAQLVQEALKARTHS